MRTRAAIGSARATLAGAAVVAVALLAAAQAAASTVSGPTDLEVVDVTATSFILTWSEPDDTAGLYGYSVRDLDNPFVNNQIGWDFDTTTTVEAEPETT